LKSTGPRSLQGKQRVGQNALKHGLAAKDAVTKFESEKKFEEYRVSLVTQLCPIGAAEELLCEKIVTAAWRLRRVIRLESTIMDDSIAFSQQMGFYFMGQNGITMHTLSRYESMLEKSFYRAFHELQRLQAMRLGHPVALPIAIDTDTSEQENWV
jgi:hypothetical protein